MKHRTVSIDKKSRALQRFFRELHDDAVIVEMDGSPVCVLYPTARLTYIPEGQLQEARGAWHIPAEVARAISEGL